MLYKEVRKTLLRAQISCSNGICHLASALSDLLESHACAEIYSAIYSTRNGASNNVRCADGRAVCGEGLGLLAVHTASSNPASGMEVCPLSLHVVWAKVENLRQTDRLVSARFRFTFLHIRIVDLDNFWTFYIDWGSLRHHSVSTDCTYALDTLAPVIPVAMHSYPVAT